TPDGAWTGTLELNRDIFTRQTAKTLAASLQTFAKITAEKTNKPIKRIEPDDSVIAALSALAACDASSTPALPAQSGIAHRMTVEAVRAAMAGVLGIDIDVEANFFAAGGNSLAAVSLAAHLARELDAEVSVQAVFACPTPVALAAHIDGAGPTAPAAPEISVLRDGGCAPARAVICLPPATGQSRWAQPIAALLPDDVRILSARLPGLLEEEAPARSIEKLAARWLELLEEARFPKDVTILGWSHGGHVGMELASLLVAAGYRLRALVVLDSAAPHRLSGTPPESDAALLRQLLAEVRPGVEADRAAEDVEEWVKAFRDLPITDAPGPLDADGLKRLAQVVRAAIEAGNAYAPSSGEHRITLIRAANGRDPAVPGALWWDELTSRAVTVDWVDGTHTTMVTGAGAHSIANILTRLLDEDRD
ncbi:MAG: alpha/beta fold hydrolase, partial [Pseudomonadota bacterium]